jgi:ACR3 family arsenite transporter
MIAPLADIPVLLALTWLAPYIKKKFQWGTLESVSDHKKSRFELRVRLDFHQYTDEQHDTPVKKASESLFSTTKSLARLSLPGCTV